MTFDFTPFRAGKRGVAMRRPSGFCWAAAVVGLVLLLPAGAFAQPEGAGQLEVPPGGIVHTVVAGDTLWDLSAKYMGSPWKWKEIWELNRFVTNPHYIYPGIRIVIVPSGPREAALVVEPPAAPAAAPEASPVAATAASVPVPAQETAYLDISEDALVRAGQFLREKPKGIGKITGGKDPKEGFSEGDTVYLSLDGKIQEGQMVAVYRVRGPLSVPGGRVSSGYVKFLLGILQMGPIEEGRPTAVVRQSFLDITRDDIVSDEIPAYSRVKILPGDESVRATVIASRNVNVELATGDFIFIDSGSSSGVEVGNVFRIYRATELEAGASTVKRSKTKIEVARAVVVRADKDFSTLYVNGGTRPFDVGSEARRGLPSR